MELTDLNQAIKEKTLEFEKAIELEKKQDELLKIYKELKELRFKKVLQEYNFRPDQKQ